MKEERNGGKRTRDVSHLEECLYVVTGSVRQTVCGKINQITYYFPFKEKNPCLSQFLKTNWVL